MGQLFTRMYQLFTAEEEYEEEDTLTPEQRMVSQLNDFKVKCKNSSLVEQLNKMGLSVTTLMDYLYNLHKQMTEFPIPTIAITLDSSVKNLQFHLGLHIKLMQTLVAQLKHDDFYASISPAMIEGFKTNLNQDTKEMVAKHFLYLLHAINSLIPSQTSGCANRLNEIYADTDSLNVFTRDRTELLNKFESLKTDHPEYKNLTQAVDTFITQVNNLFPQPHSLKMSKI